MSDEPLVRALVDAARELGRCTAKSEALSVEFTELHNFVNEQLTVNYADLAERIGKLEARAIGQRASWKTITAIAAGIAGSSGLIALAIDWFRQNH
jgi:hypothetical protein